MKSYKPLLILIQVLAIPYFSYCQGLLNNENKTNKFAPASPNVAAFQKYGDIPIDYSSGTHNISIPLGKLKLKDFEWPISVSYHSAGNRVSEVASSVGLGWVLNATSIVSEKVIGENDLVFSNVANSIKRNLVTGGYTGYFGACAYYNQTDQDLAGVLSQANVNTLPDIFYVNGNNINCKFFLRDNTGYGMPRTNNKITYVPDQYNLVPQSRFEILDENGNKYIYQSVGINVSSGVCTNAIQLSPPNYSFYLTKIVTYYGEELNFYYTTQSFTYELPPSQAEYEKMSTNCVQCIGSNIESSSCTNTYIANEKRLDKIESSSGEFAIFEYADRDDLPGASKLSRVKLGYTENGVQYTKVDKTFVTSYFGSGTTSTNLRLKLDQIKDYDTLTCQFNRYSFNYDVSGEMPDRLSYACDVFGFYNGQNSNSSFLMPSANRVPNSAYAQYSMLKRIVYPTSGFTEFNYEYDLRNGGLRVLNVKDYDNTSASPAKSRQFEYQPANIYLAPSFTESIMKSYLIQSKDQPVVSCNLNQIGSCYAIYSCAYLKHNSVSSATTYDQYFNYKKYETVKEIFGENGEGGYIEYKYDYPKTISGYYKTDEIANLEPQLIQKSVYEKNSSSYRIVAKNDYLYQIPDDQYDYFSESNDIRIKNNWGLQLTPQSEEYNVLCSGSSEIPLQYCIPMSYSQANFKLVSLPLALVQEVSTSYSYTLSGQQSSAVQTNYYYEDDQNCLATKVTTITSDGKNKSIQNQFPTSVQSSILLSQDEILARSYLVSKNKISDPIYSNVNVNSQLVSASFNSYQLINSKALLKKQFLFPTGSSDYLVEQFENYDANSNVQQIIGSDGISIACVYNLKNNNIIATFKNAVIGEIAYTSFEPQSNGGFNIISNTRNYTSYLTGRCSYDLLNGSISFYGVNSAKQYRVVLWSNSIAPSVSGSTGVTEISSRNGWHCYQYSVIGVSSVTISGNVSIDEVCVCPADAVFSSFYVEPMVGLKQSSDQNFKVLSYEYDYLNRLEVVRSEDYSILKKYNYSVSCGSSPVIPICQDVNPNWQNLSIVSECEINTCGNTGYQMQAQKDINPCSATYNQTRSILVFNPTNCPVSSGGVTISYQNNLNVSGFVATYTNRTSSQVFTFSIPPLSSGVLGCIPAGSYILNIQKLSNNISVFFSTGCQGMSGTTGYFGKVNIASTGSCNSISLSSIEIQ